MIARKNNPPSRYPEGEISSQENWAVAKVYSRQEKAFAFELLEKQIEYYLPMYPNRYQRKDTGKTRMSILPLFPTYIAYRCAYQGLIRDSRRVVEVLEIRDQRRFVDQLNRIYRLYKANNPAMPIDGAPYLTGEHVRVVAGPLQGMIGTIVTGNSKRRLVLTVDALGSYSVNVDSLHVERLTQAQGFRRTHDVSGCSQM